VPASFGELRIDGRRKWLAADLLERLSDCRAHEAGIELDKAWRAA
jgi:hypothetical protein